MAAEIVILDIREQTGGLCNVRFLLWLAAANPYPVKSAVSQYPDIQTDPAVGPSGQNIPAGLISGAIVEESYSILVPTTLITGGTNWTGLIEPYVLAILNARKSYHAGTAPALPDAGLKYKILHDTVTGWSA